MAQPDSPQPKAEPHRSPFRYPGGKSWLIPHVRAWLAAQPTRPQRFIEPFAGGASVGLAVAAEGLAAEIVLIERDPAVAAVWRTIFGGGAGDLATAVRGFELSPEHVSTLLATEPSDDLGLALRTIVRNRVSWGGIMAPRAGLVNAGERRRGLASRWYPETLGRRIEALAGLGERVRFLEGDGMAYIAAEGGCGSSTWFLDPPYSAGSKRAGSRLYAYAAIDHERLFALTAALAGPALLTYANDPGIHSLARRHGLLAQPIAMRNTRGAPMTELLLTRP